MARGHVTPQSAKEDFWDVAKSLHLSLQAAHGVEDLTEEKQVRPAICLSKKQDVSYMYI